MTSLVYGRVFSQLVNMVVQDTCEDRVEDKHDDTIEQSDSEHRNGTKSRNGSVNERLENSSQGGEDNSDGEQEAVDLSR